MSAAEHMPRDLSLDSLRLASKGCTGCDLYKLGTQTVFGEGPQTSPVMMVGEQPGDHEDIEGKPFVGPAGKLLDTALAEAGIGREDIYVTNVVKHFKWMPRGKRRIHKKPNAEEIRACKPWLEAELTSINPRIVVCLGATAAQALLGPKIRVTKDRGRFLPWSLPQLITVTIHPSSILRAPDEQKRQTQMQEFVSDLEIVAKQLALG